MQPYLERCWTNWCIFNCNLINYFHSGIDATPMECFSLNVVLQIYRKQVWSLESIFLPHLELLYTRNWLLIGSPNVIIYVFTHIQPWCKSLPYSSLSSSLLLLLFYFIHNCFVLCVTVFVIDILHRYK